jgi:hypothetical protein
MKYRRKNLEFTKDIYLKEIKNINATLAVTFKTPKISVLASDEPTRLSTKDTEFFEQNVLRMFYINMSRRVKFEFAAYPEDRTYNSDITSCPLHYHAVFKSKNDAKFKAIAKKKYVSALQYYNNKFWNVIMPSDPIFISPITRDDPEKSYEEYILKHYYPSRCLVTHKDFMKKSTKRN